MEGRYPYGIRIVLADCTDPAREAEFNEWYNRTHLADILSSGLFTTATRYERINPEPGEAKYLAIYETDREDLETVLEEARRWTAQLREEGRMHPLLQAQRITVLRRIGPEFRTGEEKRVTGLLAVASVCTDPAREAEFNDWYNQMHVLDQLGTGLYHTAYRYEYIEPDAEHGRYLALYETDAPDPEEVSQEILQRFRPKWVEQGRWTDLIKITWRANFRRIWPEP